MGALVFVTFELSPFSTGGIGRVVHNILKAMSDDDRRRSIVLLLDHQIDSSAFAAVFPDVRLVHVDSNDESQRFEDAGHHPPRWAYQNDIWYWRSAVVFSRNSPAITWPSSRENSVFASSAMGNAWSDRWG